MRAASDFQTVYGDFICFNVKFANSSKSNWMVSAFAVHGNPYDDHTLDRAFKQSERLTCS